MKTKVLIGCVLLQLGILGWMAGEREWVRHFGRTVYFRTAPVDPRDVMRGDYVRLRYAMSQVSSNQWRGSIPSALGRDARVYAVLRLGGDGVANFVSLGSDRPRDGLFIRGRTATHDRPNYEVRYGLEAWFVEQGKGRAFENGRIREGIQVPMEMRAALSANGLAVLTGYRWCPLGIGLNVVTTNEPTRGGLQRGRLISATVELLNAGSNDLAIVDLPHGGSLKLVSVDNWNGNPWRWIPPSQPLKPEPGDVIILKPGQVHSMRINFEDPRWRVRKAGGGEAGTRLDQLQADWNTQFRFEYSPPSLRDCTHLPHADLIWHGELQTRAFAAVSGRVD